MEYDRSPINAGNLSLPGRSTVESKWHKMYDATVRLREFVREPYLGAFAPLLVGAGVESAEARRSSEISILVVGGGDGHFSRNVLPLMRAVLRDAKTPYSVKATESDLVDLKSPAIEEFLQIDISKLRFMLGGRRFDLVVSESALHHAMRPGLREAVSAALDAVHPRGSLIHSMDGTPDPSSYAPKTLLEELRRRRGSTGPVSELASPDASNELNVLLEKCTTACYETLIGDLRGATKRYGGEFYSGALEGTCLLPDAIARSFPYVAAANEHRWLTYTRGCGGARLEPVPDGHRAITYEGMVTISAKHSIDAVLARTKECEGAVRARIEELHGVRFYEAPRT